MDRFQWFGSRCIGYIVLFFVMVVQYTRHCYYCTEGRCGGTGIVVLVFEGRYRGSLGAVVVAGIFLSMVYGSI